MATRNVARILGQTSRTIQRKAERGELEFLFKAEGLTGAYFFDPAYIEALTKGDSNDDHN